MLHVDNHTCTLIATQTHTKHIHPNMARQVVYRGDSQTFQQVVRRSVTMVSKNLDEKA